MKKNLFTSLILLTFLGGSSYALTPDEIIAKYENYENSLIQTINIDEIPEDDLKEFQSFVTDGHIDSIRVVVMESIPQEDLNGYRNDINSVEETPNQEILLQASLSEDNELVNAIIITSKENEVIKNIIMFVYVEEDDEKIGVIINFFGTMNEIDAEALKITPNSIGIN